MATKKKKTAKKSLHRKHRLVRRLTPAKRAEITEAIRSRHWIGFMEAAMRAGEPVTIAQRKADAALKAFEERWSRTLDPNYGW